MNANHVVNNLKNGKITGFSCGFNGFDGLKKLLLN